MPELAGTTPVLVGVAAVQQKCADYQRAAPALTLMEQALRAAALDAGNDALLTSADEISVPKGIWDNTDPAGELATGLGASSATTVLAEIGVLQQTLMSRACQRIASGEAKIVLVTGAEAKYRSLCAAKAGETINENPLTEATADVILQPDSELWSEVESAAGLAMPVGYYALIDSALRYAKGQSVAEHRDEMATLYARFSEVAAANPDAWVDEPVAAGVIRNPGAGNRMLAFPYTKLHNSQWNVDQAAGLIFCSVATARELGVNPDRWVFPTATAESNFMSVVSSRQELGGCPGFRFAGAAAAELAGLPLSAVRLREFYSCFPAAVRSQLQEFGLTDDNDLTVTGGMTFGGGPVNNFVLQATVKMAQLLRTRPGDSGLVTSVSGMLTKQACALWSATPHPEGWRFRDVTEAVRDASAQCELVADYEGEGRVAGYTVLHQGGEAWRAVAIFDLPGARRTVAYSEAPSMLAQMESDEECCGLTLQLAGGQFHS